MRRTPSEALTAKLRTALTAGEGLLALVEQRSGEAVERLTAAVEAERAYGFVYDAACLELDLARALEADGRADAAAEARGRAASVLEPLAVRKCLLVRCGSSMQSYARASCSMSARGVRTGTGGSASSVRCRSPETIASAPATSARATR